MPGGDGFWAPLPGGGGGSGVAEILAFHNYNPGTQADLTSTSTSFVDVDATNMAVTFTAPASGKVLIDISAATYVGAGVGIDWALRVGSTDVAGTNHRISYGSSGDRSTYSTLRAVITGLVADSSYTYKLAQRVGVGSGTVTTRVGGSARGNAGPAVFVVTALP